METKSNDFLSIEDFGGDATKFKDLIPYEWLQVVATKAIEKEGWLLDNILHLNLVVDPISPDHNIASSSRAEPVTTQGGRKVRKAKRVPKSQAQTSPLPAIFLAKINELGGSEDEPELMFAKELYATDVSTGQYRLSMPIGQCHNVVKLRDDEMYEMMKVVDKKYVGMTVDVIQPKNGLEVTQLCLKKYDVKGVYAYIFGGVSWNTFVVNNGLKEKDIIQVWHFRLRLGSKLCFAIVKVDRLDIE